MAAITEVTEEMIDRVMRIDESDYPDCPLCGYSGLWNTHLKATKAKRDATRAVLEAALLQAAP